MTNINKDGARSQIETTRKPLQFMIGCYMWSCSGCYRSIVMYMCLRCSPNIVICMCVYSWSPSVLSVTYWYGHFWDVTWALACTCVWDVPHTLSCVYVYNRSTMHWCYVMFGMLPEHWHVQMCLRCSPNIVMYNLSVHNRPMFGLHI